MDTSMYIALYLQTYVCIYKQICKFAKCIYIYIGKEYIYLSQIYTDRYIFTCIQINFYWYIYTCVYVYMCIYRFVPLQCHNIVVILILLLCAQKQIDNMYRYIQIQNLYLGHFYVLLIIVSYYFSTFVFWLHFSFMPQGKYWFFFIFSFFVFLVDFLLYNCEAFYYKKRIGDFVYQLKMFTFLFQIYVLKVLFYLNIFKQFSRNIYLYNQKLVVNREKKNW
eukprot:TRINITY_DN2990_c1_g1_i2.p2 TRINITY_DN2990_c1_g1~~TRINITY_DN2990_c1_g1_i2.p2  ORF type:complete len:221 (+),score=-24.51 TRINITY_DN2990_c1_g1_i2:159-821(+)